MSNEQESAQEQLDLKRFFEEIKTIAVVGYSDNPERAGHYVAHHLANAGYEVIALNPKFGDEINGLKCYANLESIPPGTQIDVVDVFRAPPYVPDLARAAAELDPKPRYFVMQPGAESPEAAQLARESGIQPLEFCMMAMHKVWGQ